jgi:hypothetical protein
LGHLTGTLMPISVVFACDGIMLPGIFTQAEIARLRDSNAGLP